MLLTPFYTNICILVTLGLKTSQVFMSLRVQLQLQMRDSRMNVCNMYSSGLVWAGVSMLARSAEGEELKAGTCFKHSVSVSKHTVGVSGDRLPTLSLILEPPPAEPPVTRLSPGVT